ARVAASAFNLVRALLTDWRRGWGQRRKCDGRQGKEEREKEEAQQEDDAEENAEEEESLACCVEEFCNDQVKFQSIRECMPGWVCYTFLAVTIYVVVGRVPYVRFFEADARGFWSN
ncbi:unnamed protein product, partial [Ectocarpus sp. 4 AP-2014]